MLYQIRTATYHGPVTAEEAEAVKRAAVNNLFGHQKRDQKDVLLLHDEENGEFYLLAPHQAVRGNVCQRLLAGCYLSFVHCDK